mmetsp:Transcript_13645/g.11645  ORF Transcript_13645/g.11645 Transcript_13645/m.11645 type:complete len:128 (+) Transcript_13645:36-419(+)
MNSPILFLYNLGCFLVYSQGTPNVDGFYSATVPQPISSLTFDPDNKVVCLETDEDTMIYVANYTQNEEHIDISLSDKDLNELKEEYPDKIGGATFQNLLFYPVQDMVTVNYFGIPGYYQHKHNIHFP